MNQYAMIALAALVGALLYDLFPSIVGQKLYASTGLSGFEIVDVLLAIAVLFLAY